MNFGTNNNVTKMYAVSLSLVSACRRYLSNCVQITSPSSLCSFGHFIGNDGHNVSLSGQIVNNAVYVRLCKRTLFLKFGVRGFASCLNSTDSDRKRRKGRQTVETACRRWSEILEKNGIPEPRVSVEFIVAHVIGQKTLYGVSGGCELSAQQVELVNALCQQRLHHKPVQYIVGEWDFHGIELKMRPPVFIPRPETEELVDRAVQMLKDRDQHDGHLLEVCCGSGAITLSLLNKFPLLTGVAVDISSDACSLTEENAQQLGLSDRIAVVLGDVKDLSVQEKLRDLAPFDMLVSNPPYVPTDQMSSLETQILQYEDHIALDGGVDGLDVIRHILHMSPHLLKSNSDILLEIQPGQPEMIGNFVRTMGQSCLQYVTSYQDYLDRERFCVLRTVLPREV